MHSNSQNSLLELSLITVSEKGLVAILCAFLNNYNTIIEQFI